MVYLNLLNLDGKDVEIKVVDGENRIVFQETARDEMLVEKAFNFKNAYAGDYTVVVKGKGSTYYENIVVK